MHPDRVSRERYSKLAKQTNTFVVLSGAIRDFGPVARTRPHVAGRRRPTAGRPSFIWNAECDDYLAQNRAASHLCPARPELFLRLDCIG